jgi:hypothetical protein
MKIGLLYTCYNCENYIDSSLTPWLKLREEFNIVIAANSGMFKEYAQLGIPEKNEGTLKKLLEKKLDFLVTTTGKNLLDEDYSRDICLEYLNGGRWKRNDSCDLLIVVDGDEIYTEDNIRNIIKFVQENPDHDGYRVNMKNHTLQKDLFTFYNHDRIFWMKKNGGISRFFFDNQFEYVDHANGTTTVKYSDSFNIPPSAALINHYSWLPEDSRTKDKIKYQNLRYHGINNDVPENARCSFKWSDKLEYNEDFFRFRSCDIPILHEKISDQPFCLDFRLDFTRKDSHIDILDVYNTKNLRFEIKNGDTEELLYTVNMTISQGQNFWIGSGVDYNLMPEFKKFKITVYENEEIIHMENLHIKQP